MGNNLWDSYLAKEYLLTIFLARAVHIVLAMPVRNSKIGCQEVFNQGLTEGLETHREYLFYYALDRLRDRDQAEEVVQETFLAALAREATFSGNSTRRTWLTGILNHKVCDQLRQLSRNRAFFQGVLLNTGNEGELVVLASMGRHSADPRTELESKELREALIEALQRLPHRMAMVYQLYESEGRSGCEICQALQISPRNLWIILHRARKRLRESLSAWRSSKASATESTP